MNIVNKLTLRHLKENKGRTVITTLGICVSVAMITAVFVAVASFMNLFGEITYLSMGHWHVNMTVNQQQLEQLENDDRLASLGLRNESLSSSFLLEKRVSDRMGTGDIYTGNKANLQQMLTGVYEGSIPENENEIAVEQSLIEKNNLDWEIGDVVSVQVGARYATDEETGKLVAVNGGYGFYGNEEFVESGNEKFKITAILHDNPATCNSYDIIRGFDTDKLYLSQGESVTAYAELKNVNYKSLDTIDDIMQEYGIKDYSVNSDYLETKFAIDENSALATTIIPMAMIVLAIIMIASVVLIYNAFGMSLSERIKYIGMLASVGATAKQKKASVYYEGMILGAVGIPVGIAAGIIGIGITLKAVGDEIINTGMINGVSASNMEMDVVVPVWAIIGIVLFSILTIFISSFIPSHKASKITPIDAIRQRDEIKIKSKKLKSPKIVRKIFGYEGELAYKNLKRNGRKSRVITASIALSVVLFLSCNYFCTIFTRSIDMEVEVPYQIQTYVDYDKKDQFYEKLEEIDGIDDYYCVNSDYFELSDKSPDDQSLRNKDFLTGTYKNLFDSKSNMYINYIEDDAFKKLCQDNNIDYNDYYGDTVNALIMNNISHESGGGAVFNDKILGTHINFSERTIAVTGFVSYNPDNYVCGLNPKNTISLYVPTSNYRNVYADSMDSYTYMIGIETEEHETVYEEVYNILEEGDYGSMYVMDIVESFKTMNTRGCVLEVFVYGFIALITLITIANIINTISTGIALRRKEFAMLKSVGTTPSGFRKMISLESVFYGLKALVFALPISVALCYGMNVALSSNMIPFEINWLLYLAVIAVVFLIIGFTMLFAVYNLKNDSIVETLKEEIN